MVNRYDFHHCVDDGDYVLYNDYAALESRLAELEKDAARINFLASEPVIEGFVGSDLDVYDHTINVASENGREEPSEEDQRAGFRRMIDEAMSREA